MAKETTMITDFVKARQTVTVDYEEKERKLIANEVPFEEVRVK